jgi:pimeloyl-ACP methyl ester carboxylesterase
MSAQNPQDQYVKVGNINTRFWAAGDKGTAVILIHGLGGSVENWGLNIEALAQHHRVYAVDLVGFGRSDKPAGQPTLSQGIQFIKDFIDGQRIDKASLVGNSMGGLVVLQFAIQFPNKVGKLVLVDSAGLGREVVFLFRLAAIPLIGEFLTQPSRKGVAWLWGQIVYDSTLVTDNLVEQTYQMASLPGAQRCLLSALRAGVNFLGQRPDMTRSIVDNLATIAAPTMIFWGQQDRIISVAHAHVAAKRMPNAKLHIFDHCGHMPQMEHSEEFNKLVLEFLAR